ncbi:hypothetical protein GC163_19725 [bacterium]|nr:hypothetical protein [bacterium]
MLRMRKEFGIALSLALAFYAGRLVIEPVPYVEAQDAPPTVLDLSDSLDDTPSSGSPTPQPQPGGSQPGGKRSDDQGLGQKSPNPSSLTPREQLRQLFERRLELMNDVEITKEMHTLQQDVAELEAQKKLKEIQKLLTELIELHPNTTAANTSQMMLHHSNIKYGVPTPLAPGPVYGPSSPANYLDPFLERPATGPRRAPEALTPNPEPFDAAPFETPPATNKPGNAKPLAPVSTFPANQVFKDDGF